MPIVSKEYRYGKGLKFPFTIDRNTKRPAEVSEEEKLKQDVIQIIMTYLGERVYKPEFGSDIQDILFSGRLYVKSFLSEVDKTIRKFLPNVEVVDAGIKEDADAEEIKIIIVVEDTAKLLQTTIELGGINV